MRAWGDPDREAIHTGTFYGDPLGCAAALATIALIEENAWIDASAARGTAFADTIRRASLRGVVEVRQVGFMLGVQLDTERRALSLTRALLERGYLVLPAGPRADVLQLAPPVTVSDAQLEGFLLALADALEAP
jgi:acetylornithine/succinyldiaminopimelate/putrescine aminotransferase